MQPMNSSGMNIDEDILIATMSNFLAQGKIKEVKLEAAVQQLMAENQHLRIQLSNVVDVEVDEETG